jgi:hypothetical protein
MLEGHEGFGLVRLTLMWLRDVFAESLRPLIVCQDDEDPSFGHILICGDITNGTSKKIRRAAVWVDGFRPKRVME